jgi:hypothetical protein
MKSVAESSKARTYVYSVPKLINERQKADSLSMDNMEEYQVIPVEHYRSDMNNFSQETPFRKPRTEQCGKRKHKPDECELYLLNRWNRETSQINTCNSSQILFHLFKI